MTKTKRCLPVARLAWAAWLCLCLAFAIPVACDSRLTPPITAATQLKGLDAGEARLLSSLADLPPWDALHLFGPYTSSDAIEAQLGFRWADAKAFAMDQREDIHLALFVNGASVARVEEWKRMSFGIDPALRGTGLPPSTRLVMDRTTSPPRLRLHPAPPP